MKSRVTLSLAGIVGLLGWIWLASVDLLVAAELNKVLMESDV